jgi:DNA-binding LacI/PurR family transcriptional regulator
MMSLPKRITIKEIAHEAGVSTQTVSRVLNNRFDVAPKTRQRVQAIIDRYDYRPSQLARSLIRGHTNTIGLVTSELHHFGPSQTLIGIAEQAHRLGYTLYLSLLQDADETTLDTIVQNMLAQHVDGIIWAVVEKNSDLDRRLMARLENLPTPVVANRYPCPGLSVVYCDSAIGAALATQHLLAQGYRTIGHISGPLDEQSGQQRLAGWRQSLQAAGLTPAESLVVSGDWTAASGAAGLTCLLQQRPDLDAIFVANDQMALGVLNAAQALQRQVPQDLGVVGFDDSPESAYFTPPLSTIRHGQDLIENGRLLVRELDRAIQARSQNKLYDPQTIMVSPQLVIRASSEPNGPGPRSGSKGGDYRFD